MRLLPPAIVTVIAVVGAGFGLSSAQDGPPFPDFFWPYGIVQLDEENLAPPTQPVVAFVNGRACGQAETKVADAGGSNPPGDAGKTVFVITVLADGPGEGQRPGCGRLGDSVQLWFPRLGYLAAETPLFKAGPQRIDLTLARPLEHRVTLPFLTASP